jgi:iron uptake system EfeUOB component EfeO/EfeM
MSGTSSRTTPLPGPGGDSPPTPRRRPPRPGPIALRLAAVAVLALIAVTAAAIVPGSHGSGPARFAVASVAARSPVTNRLPIHETKVFGSDVPANRYGSIVGAQENQGVDAQGQLTSDLSPVAPSAFKRPIAAYRAYAERWSAKLAGAVATLRAGLAADDRSAARRDWATAFGDYLHLGAVYGLLPEALDRRLAGLPPNRGDRRFPGLHRIELGLWTGAAPRSLLPVAAALAHAVTQLRRTLPTVAIDTLDYTLRAHEILEDAQRDYMSGADVPWSGAGVLGTEEGVLATREVISTLVPLLQGRDNTLVEAQNWLGQLQTTLTAVWRPGGGWPAIDQISLTQRERIDGSLAGTLGALSEIPGTLETTDVPVIPTIAGEQAKR